MIRSIISLIRSTLVGPALARISILRPGDVDNFLLYVAGAGGAAPAALPSGSSVSPASAQTLDDLKADVARLSERVDVLERLTAKAHHTGP